MANQFSKTRIAAAVSAAAFGAGLSAPAGAVVVVGGNDGWEVSFDGNVNAFYTVGDYDAGYVAETADKDASRVHSGYLPAFFSFNVKTPTVGGMTGTGRISFAPVIHTAGSKTQFSAQSNTAGPIPGISGAAIDTREVLANLSGAFGEVSFGRTLSLFGRNAILNDMTLFGVGFVPGADHFGSVTFGRSGHGYTYPDFAARFQYTTPVVAGFQAAVGLYDPSIVDGATTRNAGGAVPGGFLDETDSPRFEGELSYSTAMNGATAKFWLDGTWQDVESSCSGTAFDVNGNPIQCGNLTTQAWGVGGKLGYMGFEMVGYYHDNEGLGLTAQFTNQGVYYGPAGNVQARDGDGYYLQGTYTFNGKTKVGVSYGEGNLDSVGAGNTAANGLNGDVERQLWTVGVYHDVSSWLRVVAEYNNGEFKTGNPGVTPGAETFSVGGFLFW
ncbi:MAG: porin [Gammaproteobacteria bacterium]